MRVKEYDEIQSEIDAYMRIVDDLRKRADEALRRHYGLVPGETLLCSGGVTGVFLEILNYRNGTSLPWVSVRVVTPDDLAGKRRHFYERGWEKVEDPYRT